jgi:glycosidase
MRHEPQLRRFVNKLDDGRVLLKLESACNEIRDGHILTRDGAQHPLERIGHVSDHDYFSAVVPATKRTQYAFRVQACGKERWVGPDGAETWFSYDPSAHMAFETPAWVRDAVFYQIFPDRFCNGDRDNDPPNTEPWGAASTTRNFMGGDLEGILEQLDYLGDLGITAIYLTPIFKSASNHKYDTIDYFTIDPQFGDTALLRKLVDACHSRGIRVILDAVFNHCSNLHPYFLDVREKGKKSRYWDWFHIKKWPIPDKFAKQKDALEYYECWWGFHTLPQFNYRNAEVEEYFLRVGQHWLREAGTDGWRLDVPNEVIQSFWPKFRRAVKAVNPDAYIVGEIWEDATSWLQGDQFDAVMNYRFQKALLGYFAEANLSTTQFDHTLRQIMLDYPEQATAVMLNLLGSHDTARPMTAALNGGTGVSPVTAVESLKLMAAMQFTFEGAPCIYYGDEVGLEGGKDPDCRRCFPWGKEKKSDLLRYYQRLIAIRKANPALRAGGFRPFIVDNERELYAFERRAGGNHCIVALNRSAQAHVITLPVSHGTELLAGKPSRSAQARVPARQAIIVRADQRERA